MASVTVVAVKTQREKKKSGKVESQQSLSCSACLGFVKAKRPVCR